MAKDRKTPDDYGKEAFGDRFLGVVWPDNQPFVIFEWLEEDGSKSSAELTFSELQLMEDEHVSLLEMLEKDH